MWCITVTALSFSFSHFYWCICYDLGYWGTCPTLLVWLWNFLVQIRLVDVNSKAFHMLNFYNNPLQAHFHPAKPVWDLWSKIIAMWLYFRDLVFDWFCSMCPCYKKLINHLVVNVSTCGGLLMKQIQNVILFGISNWSQICISSIFFNYVMDECTSLLSH